VKTQDLISSCTSSKTKFFKFIVVFASFLTSISVLSSVLISCSQSHWHIIAYRNQAVQFCLNSKSLQFIDLRSIVLTLIFLKPEQQIKFLTSTKWISGLSQAESICSCSALALTELSESLFNISVCISHFRSFFALRISQLKTLKYLHCEHEIIKSLETSTNSIRIIQFSIKYWINNWLFSTYCDRIIDQLIINLIN